MTLLERSCHGKMVGSPGALHLRRTTMQFRRIENVIHSAMERDQAPFPMPGWAVAVEFGQGVGHALLVQPFDRGRVLHIVKVTHYQGRYVRPARGVKPLHFL